MPEAAIPSDREAVIEARDGAYLQLLQDGSTFPGDGPAFDLGFQAGWDAGRQSPVQTAPRVVTTIEELDALPEGTIIRAVCWGDEPAAIERINGVWYETGVQVQFESARITLPATILYTPSSVPSQGGTE